VLGEIAELGATVRYKPVALEDLHALVALLLQNTACPRD
jgi:hypothetical protein